MIPPSGETLSTRTVYTGRVFTLHTDRVRMPHGGETTMDIIRHPSSVVLVAMPSTSQVVLVRQYRYAVDRWMWELPAGGLEPEETPEAAAARECHEEIGLSPGTLDRIGVFHPTPGYCDELMIFFRLGQLQTPTTTATRDQDEVLEPRVFTIGDVRRLIEAGEITDMKTALALSLLP